MSKPLQIAPDFTLPLEAVTQTFGILAKRGVGKTHTACVMIEEMLAAQLPVAIVDPVGVWWGLRSSKDGKKPGYPIYIFGGEHGDMLLDKSAGKLVADTIIDQRIPVVIDLSLFRKNEVTTFMTDFCETLYRRNREALHLVLDEADAFAPQRPVPGQQRMLGAVDDIVRRGRARGLGVTLITQRAAVINKDVLTQIEVLVALRMASPQDRKAIDEWIRAHGSEDERKVFMDSLASLPVGTAWWWSPGWLEVFQKVKVRDRRTFDSSATPKVGEKRIEPRELSSVDIEKLRAEMERLSAPPKKDRPRDKKASSKPQDHAATVKQLQEARREGFDEGQKVGRREAEQVYRVELNKMLTALRHVHKAVAPFTETAELDGEPIHVPALDEKSRQHRRILDNVLKAKPAGDDVQLRKGARRILAELAARYPAGYSKPQVGTLTKFSHRGGTFNTYLSDLRKYGFIEVRDGLLFASAAGIGFLGADIPKPKTHAEIMDMWRQALRKGAYRMLEVIVETGEIEKEELAAAVEMTATGGTFNTYLSDLRRNGLIRDLGDGGCYEPNDILFPEQTR